MRKKGVTIEYLQEKFQSFFTNVLGSGEGRELIEEASRSGYSVHVLMLLDKALKPTWKVHLLVPPPMPFYFKNLART